MTVRNRGGTAAGAGVAMRWRAIHPNSAAGDLLDASLPVFKTAVDKLAALPALLLWTRQRR